MFKEIVSNEAAKSFLQNELGMNRASGTYLFYGEDEALNFKFALAFAKGLNCPEMENDFCGVCEICKRIEHLTYGDLEILEDSGGIKIDRVRELIYNAAITSYEGRKKIYILKGIEKMKKESSNALLKLIEEPEEGSFFILLSNSLNLLPTIKSRSIILKIDRLNAQELGISEKEYKFFLGNTEEIENYLKIKSQIDFEMGAPYDEIGTYIKELKKTGEFQYKINIYKSIRDFIRNKGYLDELDKIFFAEEILRGGADRELVKEIVVYTLHLSKSPKSMEENLILKGMLKFPINLKNFLITFFSKI